MTFTKPVLLTIMLVLLGMPAVAATAQDAAAEKPAAENESLAAEAALRDLVSAGKLDDATALLDESLASLGDADNLQQLRQMIALRYASQRKYGEATEQMQKLFDYQLQRTQTAADAGRLARQAQQLAMFGSRSDAADAALSAIDQALERCRELAADNPDAMLEPIAQLVSTQAGAMAQAGNAAEARELVVAEAARLAERTASDENTESASYAHITLLTLLGSRSVLGSADEKGAEKLDAALAAAMEAFPESRRLRMQYASSESTQIASTYRADPNAAAERIKNVVDRLSKYAEDDRNLASMLTRIKSYESRIEAAKKQTEMIGKPAPALQADAWVNADEGVEDSLKGKVVLYDFWAVWCGPCIATFPHLREWRSEFADQGFEIVGITRYYGYEWDEDAGRAKRGEDVEPETEQEAVAKFLQSKDMEHPTIFTPKVSTLQKEYGVTGIPHAVLIDREGNVQMIKVGSGPANAEALHEKIKELLAQ